MWRKENAIELFRCSFTWNKSHRNLFARRDILIVKFKTSHLPLINRFSYLFVYLFIQEKFRYLLGAGPGDSGASTQDSCSHWEHTVHKRNDSVSCTSLMQFQFSCPWREAWPPFFSSLSGLLIRRIKDPKRYTPNFLTSLSSQLSHRHSGFGQTTSFSSGFPDSSFCFCFSSHSYIGSWNPIAEVTVIQKHVS